MKKIPAAQTRQPAAHFVDCKYDEKAITLCLKDRYYAK